MTTMEARQAEARMESCLCTSADWVGRVQAGDLAGAPHASTWVCGRAAHRKAAEEWAWAVTGLEPRFIPKSSTEVQGG